MWKQYAIRGNKSSQTIFPCYFLSYLCYRIASSYIIFFYINHKVPSLWSLVRCDSSSIWDGIPQYLYHPLLFVMLMCIFMWHIFDTSHVEYVFMMSYQPYTHTLEKSSISYFNISENTYPLQFWLSVLLFTHSILDPEYLLINFNSSRLLSPRVLVVAGFLWSHNWWVYWKLWLTRKTEKSIVC